MTCLRRIFLASLVAQAAVVPSVGMSQGTEADVAPIRASAPALTSENAAGSEVIETAAQLIQVGDAGLALDLLLPLRETAGWELVFWIGTAHLALGEHDAAASYLDTALSRNTELVHVWVQRAIVEQERDRPTAALRLLGVAQRLAPEFPDTYINIGYAYESLGRLAQARTAYRRFLNLSARQAAPGTRSEAVLARLTAPTQQAQPLPPVQAD